MSHVAFVKSKIEEEKNVRKGLNTPHTVKEQGEAIQNAADKDDFYERKK